MLDFNGIVVLVVLIFVIIVLYTEVLGAAFSFLIAIIIFGALKILTPSEILGGFANEQIMVIIMLLLLGDVIRKTAIIEIIFDRLFRSARSYKGFMARMMIIVSGFSAFLNNTPLVILMMPYVNTWCKKNNISPSKFLMPLSFAAILGGCATLIGTSTNLIVNGMLIDQKAHLLGNPALFEFFKSFNMIKEVNGNFEVESLHLFDFSVVGVPMMILGFLYLLFIGEKFLPSNKPLSEYTDDSPRYVLEAQIRKGSRLIGQTVEQTGLKNLEGFFLFEILRENEKITELVDEMILDKDDILFFSGHTKTIAELIDPKSGLTLSEVGTFYKKEYTEVVEIVISHNSSLINKTVKEVNFRAKYDATALAIHRNGEKITGKIGDVRLKAGDALLLLTSGDISSKTNYSNDFYFISKVRDFRNMETYKVIALLGGTALALLLAGMGFISLFLALSIQLVLVIILKIASPKDLPKSIDYNLAIVIALSLAFGTAMIKTGVAEIIAHIVINVFQPLGVIGVLSGIYLITTLLAAYITNKAAVAIVFPISLATAMSMNLNPIPFILIVSFAAAANFMTPIGYQTNLMVFGPGGYSFKDFFKVGTPLSLIYMIVTVLVLTLFYF